jgi:hypothetical protein
MKSPMEQLALNIVAAGLAQPTEIIGCSQEDIATLEGRFSITLPETYRDWLRVMGRGAGHYLEGSDAFFPRLLELRDGAKELLHENQQPFSLPEDAFVFLMHQGYQFLFFRTLPPNPDPQVTLYLEGDDPVQPWNHVSEYFQQVLEDYLKLFKK